ncbi:unnamed protein product [Rotaria sp. Silwood2]|nr:unnamed protein product [Rotaria sp. Silwood2]
MANYRQKGNTGHTNKKKNCYMVDNLIGEPPHNCYNNQQCKCSHSCYDPNSKMYFVSNSYKKQHVPPPSASNMELLNSPARSLRRSHSNVSDDDDDFQTVAHKKSKQLNNMIYHNNRTQASDHQQQVNPMKNNNMLMNASRPISPRTTTNHTNLQQSHQQQNITTASTRFALTRYPFPPHIVRFNSNTVTINKFKEDITKHVKNVYQLDIEVANCRTSNLKCNNNEMDILLYLKDSTSFAFLLDQAKWPAQIAGEDYCFPSSPSIPPQLSLIIKNVSLNIDFDEFSLEIKNVCPEVKNVIRMKNKFGNNIKLVKIELTSSKVRQDLLDDKKLTINYISYDIDQYLAPINVLICSKCCGLGHFRKQCPELTETCRTCSQTFQDLKDHHCVSDPKCKHCNGDHTSNSMKCPVVKSFRAELTRKILASNNNRPAFSSSSTTTNNNYQYNPSDFPPITSSWSPVDSPMISKLNDVITGLAQVNVTLGKLCETNSKFEQFMVVKNAHDMKIIDEIEHLKSNDKKFETDLVLLNTKSHKHDNLMKQNEEILKQLLLPVLDDILKIIGVMNKDNSGRPLDADVRSRFELYRAQVAKASESKIFN